MKKPRKELILPDEFVLEKDEVLFIMKNVVKFWKRDNFNAIENAAYIANMELIKTAVRMNSSKVLKELFYSIITAVHEIETLNALKKDSTIDTDRKILYEIECEKIANGSAFVAN